MYLHVLATVHAVQICLSNKYILFFIFVLLLIIEYYEKLKAKVADNEVHVTEILEEKTQVEEKKQIISG